MNYFARFWLSMLVLTLAVWAGVIWYFGIKAVVGGLIAVATLTYTIGE